MSDATSCVANVDDYGQSTRLLAATTLRNVLGTKTLGGILSDRETIATDMQVTASCGHLFYFFLMDARPFMTFEIGARLEAFAAEFAEMGSFS